MLIGTQGGQEISFSIDYLLNKEITSHLRDRYILYIHSKAKAACKTYDDDASWKTKFKPNATSHFFQHGWMQPRKVSASLLRSTPPDLTTHKSGKVAR